MSVDDAALRAEGRAEGRSPSTPERKDVLRYDPAANVRKPLSQGAYRPEPRILPLREMCVNAFGGSCDRCVRACPMGCIEVGEDGAVRVDAQGCTMCGICLGVCDGLTSNDVTMNDLAARIRRTAQRGEGVVLTCPLNVGEDRRPAGNVVEVSCLAALSPEFWTLLLAQDIELTIAADLDRCVDCVRGGNIAEALYTHAIECAQSWTGREIALIDEVPEDRGLVGDFASDGYFDRRGAFAHVAGSVADVTTGEYRRRNSSVLQDFYERQDRMRANLRHIGEAVPVGNRFSTAGTTKRTMQPRRRMLQEAVELCPEVGRRAFVTLSETDALTCANCLKCTRVCLTGARIPDPHSGKLSYDERFCTGCGLCVGVCDLGAVSLVEHSASKLAEGLDFLESHERTTDA